MKEMGMTTEPMRARAVFSTADFELLKEAIGFGRRRQAEPPQRAVSPARPARLTATVRRAFRD
jgi:hypothetical protein